jgi:acyl-coenzyme A thioesterase PaaI-like protein
MSDIRYSAILDSPDQWEEINKPLFHTSGNQFLTDESPDCTRIKLRYFEHKKSGEVVSQAWFGPDCEGPPGYAHGGSIAAVLDEVMGAAAWVSGYPAITRQLSVTFRKPILLNTTVIVRTKVGTLRHRNIVVTASMFGADDPSVYSTGNGRYYVVDPIQLGVPIEVVDKFYSEHGRMRDRDE